MGRDSTRKRARTGVMLPLCALALLFASSSAAPALAVPFHPRDESRDVTGLNHACGAAVDSKGDLYLSSAGTSAIKVYDPSHSLLTSIADSNQPCGLALTTAGDLYVSERATGNVVKFHPSEYPPTVATTYTETTVDSSGKAKGIATDRSDNRLYVAAGDHVAIYKADGSFEANLGEGTLSEASGVAAYTYPAPSSATDRYLWVADAKGLLEADRLYLFGGAEPKALKLRRTLTGSTTPDGSFVFGAAGAYLAADPGNRSAETSEAKCTKVGEQACTAGHLYLYDAAHKALDEFDASGEFLDRTANAAFADAEPTALAIDRSGSSGDGTLYVTAGPGAGAKALAFGPMKQPQRAALGEPISKVLAGAIAVTTDARGYVYVAAATQIHVYKPDGAELLSATSKPLIEDTHKAWDLAVDSACNVYVLDRNAGIAKEGEATYYAPSACPPVSGTTYTRHEPVIAKPTDFSTEKEEVLKAIAVDPGPGAGKDRLFLTSGSVTHVYKPAKEGSGLLDAEFAKGLSGLRQSIAVNGAQGSVYFGLNGPRITVVGGPHGEETLARITESGGPAGPGGANPLVAVDQSNGHAVEYDAARSTAREYDASGSFVAEFGTFTEGLGRLNRVAIDSACAIKGLTGKACEEFDPANGNVYVAFDDTNPSHPPYDVSAFGPLAYATPAKRTLTVEKTGTGSGKVTSSPAGIDCGSTCSAEFDETVVVTLTTIPDPGSEFVKWEGCEAETVSPTEGTCEVTMSKDREVKAEFEGSGEVPLEVIPEGPGSGEVTSAPPGIECLPTCEANFGENVKVILTAIADPGSELVKWTGCDAEPEPEPGEVQCEVTMTEPKVVEVEFGLEHPLLTVVKKGPGSVTSSPPGIECDPTCSSQFDLDEPVTLTAEAGEASEFEGWEGCDAEPSATECELTMDEPKQVTATFVALPQAIVKPPHPIAYTEATLRGEIDTAELPTEYRFEYLTAEEYEDNGGSFEGALRTPMLELGPASSPTAVEAPLVGLEEGTEYRFRLRAMNTAGAVEDEGSFETLQRRAPVPCANATYRTGLSANLPDCRAYELVSPAETRGAQIGAPTRSNSLSVGFNNQLTVPRGEGAGEAFSFASSTTLPGFEGGGQTDGYRSERGGDPHPEAGWSTELVSPTYVQGGGSGGGQSALDGAPDQLYSFWGVNPSHSFEGTLPEGIYLRTPEGFELAARGSLGEDPAGTSQYVSAGGTHVLFSSDAHLEEEAAPSGTEAIYDRKAGVVSAEVVSLKPDGGSFGAGGGATYLGASEDGAAVAFKVGGILYLHRNGATVEIAASPNTYAGISDGGSRVFYVNASSEPAGLFACDTESGPCAGAGAHAATSIASSATFVNVSADGSHAFFTSTAALTLPGEENENHEHAEAGELNLYAWDGSSRHFIALLDPQDLVEFGKDSATHLDTWTAAIVAGSVYGAANSPARSTPAGGVFVFQSHARLGAYDNEGVGEIYRYAPAAPDGERLRCISCDPTGAPPDGDAVLENNIHTTDFVSGLDEKTAIPNLTDDGEEVFFQSPGRLLPEDSNEVEDVYEWRAKGSGAPECTRPDGCLALISSGQGETASILYAMSADGRDVFFRTPEKLLGRDVTGSLSIYDAREGGGIPEALEPAPCQGDACQGSGTEAPAIPSSATIGSGEAPVSPLRPPCAKGKHRVKGRCVAKKKHKHRHRAHANRGGRR